MDKSIEGRLVSSDFPAAFDRGSHCGLLYKLRFIGGGRQFLSIVSEFLSDRRQRVRLDGKVSASVDVVSGMPRVAFQGRCCSYCTPLSSSALLGIMLWAIRMILRSMLLFLDRFR